MTAPAVSHIELHSPVGEHFPAFIAAHAAEWQVAAAVRLTPSLTPGPNGAPEHPDPAEQALMDEFLTHRPGLAYHESPTFRRAVAAIESEIVVQEDEAKGQRLVLCGAGPSLADTAPKWCTPEHADQVWGCNSAATYLATHGHYLTHAFAIDQTAQMCEEWHDPPDVDYLLATTVHPHLTEWLQQQPPENGGARRVRWFHNFVGIKNKAPVEWPDDNGVRMYIAYEDWLYVRNFPVTVRVGSGLNSVTRALDLAEYMGFSDIVILGADSCIRVKGAWRNGHWDDPAQRKFLETHTVMHADGGHALASGATPITLQAVIDAGTEDDRVRPGHGRRWFTKPDFVVSANTLVRMTRTAERRGKGRIRIVGDVLPAALMRKNDAYLNRLPNFTDRHGNVPVPDDWLVDTL